MIRLPKLTCIALLSAIFCFSSLSSFAQTLRIAVAANAQGLIRKLQADFKERTGIKTEVITGASGKLSTQIMNGAPFDVFLSADTEFPEKLYAQGHGLKQPKVYAMGSLIVCGFNGGDFKNWQAMIGTGQVKKIAIANPKTAPYGRAAQESLKFYNLAEKIKGKLVFGESISQVNTYLQTGVVTMGFTTESFLYEDVDRSKLKWARIDPKSYNRIEQGVILLAHAKISGLEKAIQFYNYLFSQHARKIIAASGYHLPIKTGA